MAVDPVRIPPLCQVCANTSDPCCSAYAAPPQFRGDTIAVVRSHYAPGPLGTPEDFGRFRLLNQDLRYELKALALAVRTWQLAERHHADIASERRMPAGLVGLAQDSVFTHGRVLVTFFRCWTSSDEASAADFAVHTLDADYISHHPGDPLKDWLRAINDRSFHLNRHRPDPVDKHWAKRGPILDVDVGRRVGDLASDTWWLWERFRNAPAVHVWRPLLDDIETHANSDAADAEGRLGRLLGSTRKP